ncbi:hypothetical protein GCM10028801_40530 [Nocardioides maradonensis]
MAAPVVESVLVRRPFAEVATVATDACAVLPLVGGRISLIREYADGSAEWDLFLDIGTIHVGGRVVVRPTDGTTLSWQSIRGTSQSALLEVTPEDDHARVTVTVTTEFTGLLFAAMTGRLARGIVGRHVRAGLEQLRHQLEFGEG